MKTKEQLPYLPNDCTLQHCEDCDYCCDIDYNCRYIQCLKFGTIFYSEEEELYENVNEKYEKEGGKEK